MLNITRTCITEEVDYGISGNRPIRKLCVTVYLYGMTSEDRIVKDAAEFLDIPNNGHYIHMIDIMSVRIQERMILLGIAQSEIRERFLTELRAFQDRLK